MRRRNAATTLCQASAVIFGLAATTLAVEADVRNAAAKAITTQNLKDSVGVLADDTFEGRESGTRGNRAAGIYIVQQLKKLGLEGAAAKDGFYQDFGNFHNILARSVGSDPQLKDQYIVISAHYDHVGYGSSRNSFGPIGQIHNGADDNASGVAGLLEVAKAFSQLPERPKRSVLFAFWDGEEKGLIGSQHWVDHPTVPLARVPIMINVDMIGRLRNSKVEVFGVRTSRNLRRLLSRQNDTSQLTLDFNWDLKADSDHYSFLSHNIPVLMLHTGLHNDYHRPSDDAERLNAEGMRKVSELMFSLLVEIADAPTLAGFRSQSRGESQGNKRASETPLSPLPGRLGVRWDDRRAQSEGAIVVSQVTSRSAADRAGIRAGDRILRFANRDVSDVAAFRLAVLTAKNPVAATIQRPGATEPVEVTVELTGEPVRLGITWRTDEAEPNCVILNRVTPGSPADVAGLRAGDRVYAIAGREVEDIDQFRQAAGNAGQAIRLEVETDGRVRTVEIPPLPDDAPSSPAPIPATSNN